MVSVKSIYSPLSILLCFLVSLSASAENKEAKALTKYLFKDSEGSYHINSDQQLPYDSFTIRNGILTLSGSDGVRSFAIQTDLTIEQLEGVWFEYTKSRTSEISTIISRRATDYDFETVELYHDEQEFYSTGKDDLGAEYSLIENTIINENSDYFYFVLSRSNTAIQFVDSYGEIFLEQNYSGQKLLEIPQSYKQQDW